MQPVSMKRLNKQTLLKGTKSFKVQTFDHKLTTFFKELVKIVYQMAHHVKDHRDGEAF
jgi:hypothetical protein